MSEKEVSGLLNEHFKEIFLNCGFKFNSRERDFKRKVDSNRVERIQFVVRRSVESAYRVTLLFTILLHDVERTWSEMHGKKYKPGTIGPTIIELSDRFLLQKQFWTFDSQQETVADKNAIANYITETVCPWFNSIHSLADARDWLANKGKLGGWGWTTMLAMDYMLNDSEHLSSFLDSLAKDIERNPDLLQVVDQGYAPLQKFDQAFFRPVVIREDNWRCSLKEKLEEERIEIDARIAQSLSHPDKFHSELYRVYVLLGSTDETMLRNQDGWTQVLKLMKPFLENSQKGYMQFGSTSHKDSRLTIDLESAVSLNGAAERAASTVKDLGHVKLLAQSPNYLQARKEPPSLFFCCSSQIPSDVTTLKFDPFILFAVPDKTAEQFIAYIEALLRALRFGLKPKLSALQKRPFHLQSIVGGSESLIDAPIGIFRPGNRHRNDLEIDVLKGRWSQIQLED